MIERERFFEVWERLCVRFNRDTEGEAAEYYRWLSTQMTTDEYVAAATKLWATREFFPRPIDFVDAMRPSVSAEAFRQWELVYKQATRESTDGWMHMDDLCKRAVSTVGGIDGVTHASPSQIAVLYDRFSRAYRDLALAEREERLLGSSLAVGPDHQLSEGADEGK